MTPDAEKPSPEGEGKLLAEIRRIAFDSLPPAEGMGRIRDLFNEKENP